jgi:3-hydroxyisobutyrate dehydrogenase
MSEVGFIGLGKMGLPMARRLAEAGHRLTVFDVDRKVTEAFVQEHAGSIAAHPRAVAEACPDIVTMLPSSDIVERVAHGDDGLLVGAGQRTLVIEMTSAVPGRTRDLADAFAAKGASLIDAPVSGGVPRARTGELTIMVGGAEDAIERARPLLQCMGNTILPTGGIGSAHAMKAINNLISAVGMIAAVEGLLIGREFGLDPSLMVDIINVSTAMSNTSQKKLKQFMISGSFDSGFDMALMVKDMGIAMNIAREGARDVPLSALAETMWRQALADEPAADHTAIARISERLAGIALSGE